MTMIMNIAKVFMVTPTVEDEDEDDITIDAKRRGTKLNATKKTSGGGLACKTVSSNLEEEKVWNTEDEDDDDDDNDSDQGIKFDSTSEESILPGSDKIHRP